MIYFSFIVSHLNSLSVALVELQFGNIFFMTCHPFGYGSELPPCCILTQAYKKGRSFLLVNHNISKTKVSQ